MSDEAIMLYLLFLYSFLDDLTEGLARPATCWHLKG